MELASTIILGITLVAVIFYTYKTWEMASATKDMAAATQKSSEAAEKTLLEMKESRDQEVAPYVVAYFDVILESHLIYLVIKNIGKSIATDVQVIFDPPLKSGSFDIGDSVLLKDGKVASLPPSYEIRALFDTAINLYGSQELPLIYSVRISYRGGLKDDERVINQILDLSIYKGLMSIMTKGMDDLVKQVNELTKHSDKIEDALEEIAKTLDKGIWVRTPDMVVTLRDSSGNLPLSPVIAKLREFQLIWQSSLRDNDNEIIPFAQGLQAQALIICQQLLVLLSANPQETAEARVEAVSQVATKLLRLGTMKFYIDGGRSIGKFNQLGNSIVDDINALLADVETKEHLEAEAVGTSDSDTDKSSA